MARVDGRSFQLAELAKERVRDDASVHATKTRKTCTKNGSLMNAHHTSRTNSMRLMNVSSVNV